MEFQILIMDDETCKKYCVTMLGEGHSSSAEDLSPKIDWKAWEGCLMRFSSGSIFVECTENNVKSKEHRS